MKKLLYTLLLGLVVISCEKDMDGDVNSISVPSQEIEATTESITIDQAYAFINSLSGKEGVAKSTSTARSTGGHIDVAFITESGDTYAHLVSDDTTETFCYTSYTVTGNFRYSYVSPTLTVTNNDDAADTQDFTLSSALLARYDAVFSQTLNNMQYIDYVNNNPTARLGAQPSKTGTHTFDAN